MCGTLNNWHNTFCCELVQTSTQHFDPHWQVFTACFKLKYFNVYGVLQYYYNA